MTPRDDGDTDQSTDTALPGLDGHAIESLATSWDDGGLWADIRWLAERFLTAGDSDAFLAWHHLVLAVGNFKRQRGRRLRPGSVVDLMAAVEIRPQHRKSFVVPGSAQALRAHVDKLSTWQQLDNELKGAATATTTTLLAAIWPERHFVYDWRVHAVANGLRLHADLSGTDDVEPDSTRSESLTLARYAEVREWLLATVAATGQPLANVERALYRASQKTTSVRDRTWTGYGAAVTSTVRTAQTQTEAF